MRYPSCGSTAPSVSTSLNPLTSRRFLALQAFDGCRRLVRWAPFSSLNRYATPKLALPLAAHLHVHTLRRNVPCFSTDTPRTTLGFTDSLNDLNRAGREAFSEILYQADVIGEPLPRGRLVDKPQYRQDFQLWTKLLDTRLRLHGLAGAWDIWQGLRSRGVDLPISGDEADRLWTTFVSAAIQQEALKELWSYVVALYKRTDLKYDSLYEQIVGHFIRQERDSTALYWHKRLNAIDLPAPGSLAQLVDDAVKTSGRLRVLGVLYDGSSDHALYDKIITALCEHGNYRQALVWHDRLVQKNDFPSTAAIADPLRWHLALAGETDTLRRVTSTLVAGGVYFAESIPRPLKENTKISRTIMSKLLGEIHGVKPKVISDEFCARSFATRAFSVDLVIRGLTAFGAELIGPLALRELVLRCSTLEETRNHMRSLTKLGVKIHECAYAEVVQRLIFEDKADMLRSVVNSDMHPDVYDDQHVQKKILESAIPSQDWAQVHRSLTIMTASDALQRTHAWNVLLCGYMDTQDWDKITSVFNDMQVVMIFMTPKTIRYSFFALLRCRKPGKRPVSKPVHFDDLSFVANLWLRTIRSGGDVPAQAWRQVHTYFGMEGRFVEMEKLSVWLALHYSRKTKPGTLELENSVVGEEMLLGPSPKRDSRASLRSSRFFDDTDSRNPLRKIFTVQRQCAIVAWGFKLYNQGTQQGQQRLGMLPARLELAYQQYSNLVGYNNRLGPFPQWARGVALLVELQLHGVHIHPATVRKACRHRLVIMFGKGRSKRKENRESHSTDLSLLRHMIMFLNILWGPHLFPHRVLRAVERSGLDGSRVMDKQLSRHILGSHTTKQRKGIRVRLREVQAGRRARLEDSERSGRSDQTVRVDA